VLIQGLAFILRPARRLTEVLQ